jgi:hypothetical protein
LEVAIGKIGEHVEIDLVFSKLFLVSTEAKTTEPHADIHDRVLARGETTPDPLVNAGIRRTTRMKQIGQQCVELLTGC